MTFDDFRRLVASMRKAQKAVAATGEWTIEKRTAQNEQWRLEKQVDEALQDSGQKGLFNP